MAMGRPKKPEAILRQFRINKTLYEKLMVIASVNDRSGTQELEHCIKQYVEQYESQHGEITITTES